MMNFPTLIELLNHLLIPTKGQLIVPVHPHPTRHHHTAINHHPVRGHKRLNNNTLVKCNFCENKICSVSSDTSFSKCPCSWHRANQGNQSTCSSQSATSARPDTVRISVTKKLHLDVTEWLMPSYICQSSVGGGLSGSNACTVTAVLAGQHYLEETLPIPKLLQDLNCVIPLYIVLMMKGNQIHQSF